MTYEQENEAKLLQFKMNLLQAEIAMNSMIVANKEREANGYAFAYDEKAFIDLIEEYGIHHNAFPDLR